jgi:hypothetical protein
MAKPEEKYLLGTACIDILKSKHGKLQQGCGKCGVITKHLAHLLVNIHLRPMCKEAALVNTDMFNIGD